MRALLRPFLTCLLAVFVLVGCGEDDGPVAGEVHGRVTSAAGAPLAGVEVRAYGTTMAGESVSRSFATDADGRYGGRLPDGIYGVSSEYHVRFNGHDYRYALDPADGVTGKRHDAAEGIVKNFVWKISGLKPGQQAGRPGSYGEGNKYYGGYVSVSSQERGFAPERPYFAQGTVLEITLTPQGPLIDGSSGEQKVYRYSFERDQRSSLAWYLDDVPVGSYRASARQIGADGTATPLRLKRSLDFRGEFTDSAVLDFAPTSFGDLQMQQILVEPLR